MRGLITIVVRAGTGAFLSLGSAAAEPVRVPLRVVGDGELPAAGGVPLPRGRLWPGEPVRARLAGGRIVAAQARSLAEWPDGSVRWLLVDVDACGRSDVVVERGEAAPPSPRACAIVRPDGIELSTGVASCLVPAEGGPLMRRLCGRSHEEPLASTLDLLLSSDGDERIVADLEPVRLEVEEPGGVRASATIEGRLAGPEGDVGLTVRARVEAFAGRAHFRIALQLVAGDLPVMLGALRLAAPFAAPPESVVRFAVPGRVAGGPLAAEEAWRLEQEAFAPFALREGARVRESGLRAQGWVAAAGGGRALSLSIARFAELGGGVLEADAGGGLAIDLAPPGYELAAGSALRRDLVLAIGPAHALGLRPSALFPDADRLAVLAASPEWVAAAGAAGPLTAAPDRTLTGYERLAARLLAEDRAERERHRLFGPRDFGDWRLGRAGFGNLEFDTGLGFLLGFARTRDPRWLEEARDALRHLRDVDVEWVDGRPGLPRMHGPDHGSRVEYGHLWLEGLLLEGCLTGDPWAFDAAAAIRDALLSLVESGPGAFTLERGIAWTLVSLVSAEGYTASAPERARIAVARRALVDRLLRCERQRGFVTMPSRDDGQTMEWEPEGAARRRRFVRVNPWVTLGISVEGLCRAYDLEPRADAKEAIRRLARTLAPVAFDAKTHAVAGGLFFDLEEIEPPRPTRPVSPDAALFAARGLAHAAKVLGSADLLRRAREIASRAVEASLREPERLGGRERTRILVAAPALLRYLRDG